MPRIIIPLRENFSHGHFIQKDSQKQIESKNPFAIADKGILLFLRKSKIAFQQSRIEMKINFPLAGSIGLGL
jgi:hypothetical protein